MFDSETDIEFDDNVDTHEVATPDIAFNKAEVMMTPYSGSQNPEKRTLLPHEIVYDICLITLSELIAIRTKSTPHIVKIQHAQWVSLKTYYSEFRFVLSDCFDSEEGKNINSEVIKVVCHYHVQCPDMETINTLNKTLYTGSLFSCNDNLMYQTVIQLSGGVSVVNLINQVVAFINDAEYIHKVAVRDQLQ